jgi:Tol biopolymer transport system component
MRSIAACLLVVLSADARFFGLGIPDSPQPFSPAMLAELSPLVATNPAFSPDFRTFAFTTARFGKPGEVALSIHVSRFDGERWSAPRLATELGGEGFNNAEPAFSADGKWLYFDSNRPPGSPPWNVKIFRARVTEKGFEAVELVRLEVPAKAGTFYPQPQADQSLWFTSDGLGGKGGGDLYLARSRPDGSFDPPVGFGGDFNSARNDWDLAESPDGRFRVWASAREGGAGQVDIWFSERAGKDEWSAARNLTAVNTPGFETAPRFSPDGSVLFFHRAEKGVERMFWVGAANVLPK